MSNTSSKPFQAPIAGPVAILWHTANRCDCQTRRLRKGDRMNTRKSLKTCTARENRMIYALSANRTRIRSATGSVRRITTASLCAIVGAVLGFFMGQANTSEPTAEGVLDCLLSDCQAGDQTFDEFCSELGYRLRQPGKAHDTWQARATCAELRHCSAQTLTRSCIAIGIDRLPCTSTRANRGSRAVWKAISSLSEREMRMALHPNRLGHVTDHG